MKRKHLKKQKSLAFRKGFYMQRQKSLSDLSTPDYLSEISDIKRFENFDLKNVRNLKKYDCWDEVVSGEEWVKRCHEMPEGSVHCRCPIFHDYK